MKKLWLLLGLLFALKTATQAQYTSYGKIEYERKSNLYQQMEDMADGDDDDDGWMSRMKSMIPKYYMAYFDLSFNTKYTLYKPGKEADNKYKGWGTPPGAENTVFTDLQHKTVDAFKQVYEEKFLVQDTMRKLEWKIKDEIRTIANYKCRKAVTTIYDSVVVVAFYTDDIMVSGGPEMFSGLPGMILELAIPRLRTTWIATKVELTPPSADDLQKPDKGKKVTNAELFATLQKSVGKWGKWGSRSIWWNML
jgi:GLPGLI family protein